MCCAFLRRIHYGGRTSTAELLSRHPDRASRRDQPGRGGRPGGLLLALLDAVQVAARQERELEAELTERVEVDADQHRLTSLPRAGRGVRAAALLVNSAMCAPASQPRKPWPPWAGPRRSPSPRATAGWSSPLGLRQEAAHALVDFADDSRHASPWAAKVYADALARTGRHPHAVHISWPGAWLRVIWRIWQDGVAYDPSTHRGAVMLQAHLNPSSRPKGLT